MRGCGILVEGKPDLRIKILGSFEWVGGLMFVLSKLGLLVTMLAMGGD